MKLKFYFLFSIFIYSFFSSQETTIIPLQYDVSGYSSKSINISAKTSDPSIILAPTVNSEMNVNEGGGLSYMLPIETLKGVNNFQPNFALVYNSQSGNGQAGWGWNIMGLSTINQGGKSQEIDGITIGQQYDGTDPFYLDGQRLIKINDTDFVTEKFSKIKITKPSTGEFSFIVQYTDGKIAKYKEITSGQHYISVFIDALDNQVHYTYLVSGNTPRLTKVSYGGTDVNTDKFSIDFTYKARKTPAKVYRNTVEYLNNLILSEVSSNSTYGGLYRKYVLTHDFISANTTERLIKIEVQNEVGEKLKPLQFDYNLGVNNGNITKVSELNSGLPANAEVLGDIVAGDFYGDGKQTFCFITKDTDGNFVLRNSSKGSLGISVSNGSKLIPTGKILNSENKISDRDQLIIAHTGLFAKLEIVDLLTMQRRTLDTGFQANGTWTFNILTGQYSLDLSKSSDNYVSGDFNNDGLLDLIHFIPGFMYDAGQIRLFEIGKTTGTQTETISIANPTNNYFIFDKVYPIEMDGDGIPEIMFIDAGKYSVFKFDYQNKKLVPYNNLQNIQLSNYVNDIANKRSTPLIFGDFNGDGLTDFMTPQKIYYIDKDNNSSSVVKRMETEQQLWWEYLSNGKSFVSSVKDLTADKVAYIVPSQRVQMKQYSFWQCLWSNPEPKVEFIEYGASTVVPTDFDHDGKTDLITFSKFGKVKYSESKKLNDLQIQNMDVYITGFQNGFPIISPAVTTNKIFLFKNTTDSQGNIVFKKSSTVLPINTDLISPVAVPLMSTDFNQLNTYKSKLLISDPVTKRDLSFVIDNDSFNEGMIKKVDNGSGVDQVIEYRPMVENTNTNVEKCYSKTKDDLEYPYYIHKNNGTFYLVNKIHTIFDDKILTKEYRFENGVQKLDGKGFLGFQKNYVSDTYESEIYNGKYRIKNPLKGVFWSIQTKDPLMDNAVIISEYGGIKKAFTIKTSINKKFDRGNHQYLILTTDESSTDNLKKITINKKFEYDENDDLKLKTAYTDYNGIGSSVSKFSYKPEFYNGNHYFYGKFDTVENITYKDALSFGTKEINTYYPNGLIWENKKYGNTPNAPPIVTTYDYYNDNTGNIKSQTINTSGITAQTTSFEYDTTKRYINKTTTPDGLYSTSNINFLGRVFSETSSLGLTTSYIYDTWGNITEITDYLGKKTTISKSVNTDVIGGIYNLSKKREGGIETIVTFDKFDREIQSKSQSINNKWLVIKTEYDVYGRKSKTSEPYFDGEAPKWNTTEYDELNRPIKSISYTGKVVKTCYEGMKVTTEDGYKKMSKTFDAMGNAVRLQDHGGVINYVYYPNGALKETNYEGIKTTFEIDGWGNKTKIVDPSAGTFIYEYDNLSRITKEENPKGYTTYQYDNLGRPTKEITQNKPNTPYTYIDKTYTYNANTKLPETITGTSNGKAFTYTTYYDSYYRIKSKKEETPDFTYTSSTTFDSFGKSDVVEIKAVLKNPSYTTTSSIKNIYDTNGILIQQNDNATNTMVWHVTDVNAQGQTLQMEYGNGFILTNQYTADQMLKKINHSRLGASVLDIDYNYNVNKGVLLSRNNNTFGKNETYDYDTQNRLIKETVNGIVTNEYTFDKRGRMTSNTDIGKYNYNQSDYRLQNLAFNANGQNVNTTRGFADITYNAYKSPIEIKLSGKDDIFFDYNILKTRYSSSSTVTGRQKLYSSDFTIEITKQGNKTEIITYITGDPYSANYIKKTVINNGVATEGNYYLHRDNLGSILAITQTDGAAVEKRYFDAWGNLKAMTNASNQLITSSPTMLFMDRGYTGHEHLQSVGLIHMNARIYDPLLRRFLSPDNEISDPFNTQAYDRYSYVLNNPLLYIDQSGNNPLVIIAIFMAACDIFMHVMDNISSGVPFWYGLGKVIVVDGLSSALSFGIGAAVKGITNFALKALVQAGMHAVSGGLMSELSGGKFISGFAAGAISSLVSSGVEALGINFSGEGAYRTAGGGYSQNSFGGSDLQKAVMIAAGALGGGLSSTIAGGNFWAGFKQGVITSGLNHLAHLTAIDLETITFTDINDLKERYPRFYKTLSKLQDYATNNKNVMDALVEFSGYSRQQLVKMLEVGNLVNLISVDNNPRQVFRSGNGKVYDQGIWHGYGEFDPNSPHKLSIMKSWVKGLEQATLSSTIQGTSFILAVTVYHELIHYSRYWNNLPDIHRPEGTNDNGFYFEYRAFDKPIYRKNANENSTKFNWKF